MIDATSQIQHWMCDEIYLVIMLSSLNKDYTFNMLESISTFYPMGNKLKYAWSMFVNARICKCFMEFLVTFSHGFLLSTLPLSIKSRDLTHLNGVRASIETGCVLYNPHLFALLCITLLRIRQKDQFSWVIYSNRCVKLCTWFQLYRIVLPLFDVGYIGKFMNWIH